MAGHGSPPPQDKGDHPGRKVDRQIGTQPIALPLGKYRTEPNMVQRVRRAQPTGTQHPAR